MTRRPIVLLAALALIWGSSFMFIKIADRELAPATLVLGRLALATLTLLIVVPLAIGGRETLAQLRANWAGIVLVGLLNTAMPFWLLSWGETRIDSGLASIIQASVPIFNAVLAFAFFPAHGSPAGSSSASASASSASHSSSVRSRTRRCSARWPWSGWPCVTPAVRLPSAGT